MDRDEENQLEECCGAYCEEYCCPFPKEEDE